MTEPRDVLITMEDVTLAGHCARGTKAWFEGYGLDFRDFLKHGIDGETFLGVNSPDGDAYAQQVYDRKLAREA